MRVGSAGAFAAAALFGIALCGTSTGVAAAKDGGPPPYISMEKGLDPSVLGPDSCTSLMNTLGQCSPTHLDPAYAPPLGIDREPATNRASTPSKRNAACGGERPRKANGKRWTCTFDDEFSGKRLDRTKWEVQLTSATNFTSGQDATKTCYVDSPKSVAVGGGELRLMVRKTKRFSCVQGGNKPPYASSFISGGVDTLGMFSQAFGRFEIRAAFPKSRVRGLQSSLWMWPDDPLKYGPWPASGEIDIAEYYTGRPGFVVPTLHYNANPAQHSTAKGINATQDAFCHFDHPGQFHDYTAVWDPKTISIYYDGTLCLFDHWRPLALKAPAPFDAPFFLVLTAGLGLDANSYAGAKDQLPATTRVDWVRVWK